MIDETDDLRNIRQTMSDSKNWTELQIQGLINMYKS